MNQKENFDKIIRGTLFIIIAAVIFSIFFESFGKGSERLPISGHVTRLEGQWETTTYEDDDVHGCEYTITIPETDLDTQILSIKVFWYSMDVFVDGEKICSYQDLEARKGVNRQWIVLPQESSGKKLQIRVYSKKSIITPKLDEECYIGGQSEVLVQFLLENLYAAFLGGFTLLLGLILLLFWRCFKHNIAFENLKEIKSLGLFIFVSGGWILTDSQLLQIFIKNTSTVVILSFVLFMLMPFFFMSYFRGMMIQKKKSLDIMCICLLVSTAASLLLHIFDCIPIFCSVMIFHLMILIIFGMVNKYSREEIRKFQNEEMREIQIGMVMILVFAVLAIIIFYINPLAPYALFYGTGLVIFEIFLVVALFKRLYFHLERSANAAAYHELAYKDLMTGMRNRTEFVETQEKWRDTEKLAYIIFDVNNLKMVNDNYGHKEGDKVIITAAECILKVFEKDGKCFRIGGDEFLVMIKDFSEQDICRKLDELEKMTMSVSQTEKIPVDIAFGYALRESKKESVEHLFTRADENMYEKKRQMKQSG